MHRVLRPVCLAVALSIATTAQAGKVKVWHHHAPVHYEKARLQGAVVNKEGNLRLARQLRPFAELDATHVWAIVEDQHGDLLVATGDAGKIYKVDAAGTVVTAFQTEDSQVFCLAKGKDGTIYAGTGPNGRVYRIDGEGKCTLHYQCPDSYIWCLAPDADSDAIFAGTGPKGKIYRVASDGSAVDFYATKQDHVLCLSTDREGRLYAGTDKNGLVIRIDAQGKGFVLYDAAQSEVRCLFAASDGLYAGTSAPRRRDIGGRPVAEKALSPGVSAVLASGRSSTATSSDSATSVESNRTSEAKDDAKKGSPAPTASPPAQGENSIYRLTNDGVGREVFREKAMILSLLSQGSRLLVGTGADGQLFEIDLSTKECAEIARLDHGHLHCLCRRRDGSIIIGAGDPGKLYVLEDKFMSRGSVVSSILDAKLISRWGSLRWQADTPPETKVTLAVRSGNLAEPDETWSDWSEEQADAESAMAVAPPARYLQYRITLTSNDPAATPAVRNVTVRYRTTNQAPEIETLEVPNLDAGSFDPSKKIRLKWTAIDPNEDELTYRLYIRREGWKDWVLLEDSVEKREYEWDTTTAPAGMYQIKVVASDRKDNAAEEALTGERISPPFPVAHMPPAVKVQLVKVREHRAIIEASAEDPLVRLASASFTVDGKEWANVFPSDGLFDRKSARFQFETDALRPGHHVLVLKVRDAAGNTGAGDVVFRVPNE